MVAECISHAHITAGNIQPLTQTYTELRLRRQEITKQLASIN